MIDKFLEKCWDLWDDNRTLFFVYAALAFLSIFLLGGSIGLIIRGGEVNQWGHATGGFNPFNIPYNLFMGFTDFLPISFFLILLFGGVAWFILRQFAGDINEDERGFKYSVNGTYGTARMLGIEEAREFLEFNPVEEQHGAILGWDRESDDTVSYVDKPQYEGDKRMYVIGGPHVLIMGSSGARKSRSWAIPRILQAIRRGESLILTDPKGELYAKTKTLLEKYGYVVKQFNLVNKNLSDPWDVLGDAIPSEEDIMFRGRELISDMQVFANIIISNTRKDGRAGQFEDLESAFFQAAILYVATEYPENQRSFPDVVQFMFKPFGEMESFDDKTLAGCFNILKKKEEHLPEEDKNPAIAFWGSIYNSSPNLRDNVITGMKNRLSKVLSKDVRSILTKDEDGIDILLPGKRKCAYFVIMSDQDATFRFLVSLFFSFFFLKIIAYADTDCNGVLPVPVHLIMDEFANIGAIPDFAKKIATIRSRGVSVSIIIQQYKQLETVYPTEGQTIAGNCDIQIFLGGNDPDTLKYVSVKAGEATIAVHTKSGKVNATGINYQPTYNESDADGKRMVMTPDEVGRMDNDDCLVMLKGKNVLRLQKFDYSKHQLAKEMTDFPVLNYVPNWRKKDIVRMYLQGKYTEEQKELLLHPNFSVGNGIELSDDIEPVSEGRTNQLMDLLPERENSGAPILNQKGIDYLLKHGLCNENEAKYLKALMSHKQDLLDPEANMNENLSQEDQELLKETLTDEDMEHIQEEAEAKVEVNSKPKPSSRRRRKKSSTSTASVSTTIEEKEDVSNNVSSTMEHIEEDDIPEEQEEKVKISTPFVFGASEEEDSNKEDAAYDKTSEMLQQMEELRLFDEEQEVEDYLNSPNDEEEESLEESARSAFDGLF